MKKNFKVFDCEVLLWFMRDGVREQRWILREVESISDGSIVRCKYCLQPVRIHRQRKPNGPKDHVEHMELNSSCDVEFYSSSDDW